MIGPARRPLTLYVVVVQVVPGALFDDARQYHATLARLGALHRSGADVVIVPSHCQETFERLQAGA